MLIDDGILLRKYWFSVSDAEQLKRFRSRMNDPVRQWKLSPMDLESINRWEDYSRAKDEMMVHTDTPVQPLVRGGVRHEEARAAEHDGPPAVDHPVRARCPGRRCELPERLKSTSNYLRPPRESYVTAYVARPHCQSLIAKENEVSWSNQ